MERKPFKVVIRKDNESAIREVKGYFTWLNDVRVFIYYDPSYRSWYVIDLETGLSISSGHTMAESKRNTINKLNDFKEFKKLEKYKQYRFNYQRLLKEVNYEF